MTSTLEALTASVAERLDAHLAASDGYVAETYPGDSGSRQPLHTVYVPAQLFLPDAAGPGVVGAWGRQGLEAFAAHFATPEQASTIVPDLPPDLLAAVLPRVAEKLAREPIEDLRIDFEDGFGRRPDAEEDAAIAAALASISQMHAEGTLPPFWGCRFKSFEALTRRRGLATLYAFVSGVVEICGALPEGFWVTLPKVTAVEQVEAMVMACEALEAELGLAEGALRFEIQVETPQSILLPDGTAGVACMLRAAQGRASALHYGTYDYSAFCGVAAEYQSMEHAVADYAKAVMQVSAAGTGVRLSDGSTNIIPVGEPDSMRAAWQLHARLVRRHLERGYYQGWDLHPHQFATRYIATFAFYRTSFERAALRLRRYVAADTSSGVLDEPATAKALAWFILRAVSCGAVSPAEVDATVGIDEATLTHLARTGLLPA
ncbi:aldolase [Micrococcales bacterium 31B]|nr:aldolase [Micrococcales bacterium 31B]